MRSLWPRIFRAFRRPWLIVRHKQGGLWIESAGGRVLLYVYPRHSDVYKHKMPTDDEALDIVRAIARLSRRRHRPRPRYWVPLAKRRRWMLRRWKG
jgi:hypothetical protein